MRYQGGIKSDILTDVSGGDTVVVLEEMENWTKVKTQDSFIGYVENKRLEKEYGFLMKNGGKAGKIQNKMKYP